MSKIKLKTKKSAAKRFTITKSGKIKRKHAFLRHGMRKRTTSQKRKLRLGGFVNQVDTASVFRMLPNG